MTHASSPTTSILIVSYNTREMTVACLDSIVARTHDTTYEIIVVDNASQDGSAEAIRAHPSRPTLIALERNVGFAQGNNIAAGHATGDLLLLLNPDTIVLDRAIDRLVAFARARPEARIWGGRTKFADGSLNRSNAWGRMTLWNLACRACGLTAIAPNSALFNGEAYGGWDRGTERAVDIVSGCFLLIGRSDWRQLSGFDPTFFMYGEEADLCLRAARIGARPRITPEATIIHYGGASEATREGKMIKLLQAKSTLLRRHFLPAAVPFGLALLAAWPLSRWLALRAASAIRPTPARAAAARTWSAIWQQRHVWLAGYEQVAPAAVAIPTNPATAD